MTVEQALLNIENALASINASLQVHMGLQESLNVVKKELERKKEA